MDYAERYAEETNFYNKFDEQIYKYVREVEILINSVAPERDILSKSTSTNVKSILFR